MNWNLFATLYDSVITPTVTAMQAMIGPMSATMQPIALIGVSIWLIFAAWDLAAHAKTVPQIGKEAFRVMMFYSLVWAGPYTQYVSNLFLQAIPNTISAALGGNGTPAAMLDQLCGQALAQASTVYEALPGFSLKGAILTVAVLLFVVVALVCVAFMFITVNIAAVILVLALVVGPIFLAAATTPFTRRFAAGWLSVLVGGMITQLLGLALIRLLIGSSAVLMNQLVTTAQATDSNSIMMLAGLGKIGVLLWLFSKVTQEVPSLARDIGGGVYHGSQAAMQSFAAGSAVGAVLMGAATGGAGGAMRGAILGARTSASGSVIGAARGAVGGAAGGAGSAAARAFRNFAPAGRSLSRRR